jgi:hypothetical protein
MHPAVSGSGIDPRVYMPEPQPTQEQAFKVNPYDPKVNLTFEEKVRLRKQINIEYDPYKDLKDN